MKIVVTGGHFSPAYSVIEELLRRGSEVVIVGRKYPFEGDTASTSYEYRVSKEHSIPFREIQTGRLQRRMTWRSLVSLAKVPLGVLNARKILREENPDVVLTFGGYLALPIAISARMLNIPIVTHEQTQGLGLSNTLIAKIADTVCVSFTSTKEHITHTNVVITGNPMRKSIYTVDQKLSFPSNMPVLYITGGSTGSHAINRVVGSAVPQLLEKFVVIHQTGENEFNDYAYLEKVKKGLSPSLQERYVLQKFIYPSHIGYIYKKANIVIGRAGANTVLELIACNKPSILVPLPHGQTGEQLKNAQLIQDIGLGTLLTQDAFSAETLIQSVNTLMQDIEKYSVSQSIIDRYIYPDSAQRIVHELTVQYEKKKNKTQRHK